jgi:hypothetical protein
MGGHYGSIHIRTDDQDEVRIAVENLHHPNTQRFYIAPPIKGWVTVFPENNGQDHTVAEALVAKLPNKTIIYCAVHDDDIFAYWFFENGKLSDAYNSCPEYFGDENRPPRGGNATAFANLLPPQKITRLQKLLDEQRYDFELERQDKFAEILGLPNTAAAYEYIEANDAGTLKQRRKFIHIPDLAPERSARRVQKAAEQKLLNNLKAKGILLVDLPSPKTTRSSFKAVGWAQNPNSPEVIASWCSLIDQDPANTIWKRFTGPSWTETQITLPFAASINGYQLSHSGNLLAICRNSNVHIWDLRTNQLVAEHKFIDLVTSVTFGIENNYLFVTIRGNPNPQLHRIALEKGSLDNAVTDQGVYFQRIIPHPDGRFLAAIDHSGILVVIEIETMRVVIQRWLRDHDSLLQYEPFKEIAEGMVSNISQFLSPEQKELYRKQSAIHFLPKEEIRVGCFDAEGTLLFCGVPSGLRGLKWKDVFSGANMTPIEPVLSVRAETDHETKTDFTSPRNLTYATVFDAAQRRVLFTDLEGKLSYYNLDEARSGTLLTVPNNACFIEAELSSDRSALIATAHRFNFQQRNKSYPQHFQIWNYRALCETAGIQF